MARISVRVEHRDFEVIWADVKNGVLKFKELDGTVWTTNCAFVVTEESDEEAAEGRGGIGTGTGTVSAKRLRKAGKAHGRTKHDNGVIETVDSAVHKSEQQMK